MFAQDRRLDWTDTHTHTHTQTKYRNPRCACAPRVNHDTYTCLCIEFVNITDIAWVFRESVRAVMQTVNIL